MKVVFVCLLLLLTGSYALFQQDIAELYPEFQLKYESCISTNLIPNGDVAACVEQMVNEMLTDDVSFYSKGSGTHVVGKEALTQLFTYFIQTTAYLESHGNLSPYVCRRDALTYLSITDDVTTANATYKSSEPRILETRERKYFIWKWTFDFGKGWRLLLDQIVFGGRIMYAPLTGELVEYFPYEVIDVNGCKVPELEYCFNDRTICKSHQPNQ